MKQLYDEIANNPILDIKVPVERDGKDLVVTPEILAMFLPDETGRLHPIVDTSGRVTEASGVDILADTTDVLLRQKIIKNLMVSISGSFQGGIDTETDAWRFQHKVLFAPLVATAGGEIVQVNFASALAGYRTCIKITHVFSDQAQAAITFTFGTTTGLTRGITVMDITTGAFAVTPDYGQGLTWEGSAVNEAIYCLCAAGQAGANQNIWLIGEKWYELV